MAEEDISMPMKPGTPPLSRTSSSNSSKKRKAPSLSLDLSDLPPLIQPSPPSNTLIITNLRDPTIFTASTLAHLRQLITSSLPLNSPPSADTNSPPHLLHEIHSLAPLPSLSRIIVSFTTIASATHIRTLLDGHLLFDDRIRVYFGAPTPLDLTASGTERLLKAPRAPKQFFISPPPSPPHGWEIREEGPPNKEVHAGDLAAELERLVAARHEMTDAGPRCVEAGVTVRTGRSRSSTILYQPQEHGSGLDLPAIAVEDMSVDDNDDDDEGLEEPVDDAVGDGTRRIMAHTARPPVELMADS